MHSSPVKEDQAHSEASKPPDLSHLPPVFVLKSHLDPAESSELERQLAERGSLASHSHDARLFLGRVASKKRAQFELRCKGVWTEEVLPGDEARSEPSSKRRKVETSPHVKDEPDVFGEEHPTSEPGAHDTTRRRSDQVTTPPTSGLHVDTVKVVKLDWLEESIRAQTALPLQEYLVFEGRIIDRPDGEHTPKDIKRKSTSRSDSSPLSPSKPHPRDKLRGDGKGILERAKADATPPVHERDHRPFRHHKYGSSAQPPSTPQTILHPPALVHETTSEHDEATGHELPEMPLWVRQGKKYSCQRSTPSPSPNDDFIDQLKKIKHVRELNGDEIGVRAYSTAIASLAAYPHRLTSTREILALPGCEGKFARLYQEWRDNDGHIQEADAMDTDERLKVLNEFWEIWGVGPTTARDFYSRGWRDLDDLVEYYWKGLSRVQQIGVKYYDEFLNKIPRKEVEEIAAVVVEHAKRVRDDGIECCIVGGYRRGKKACGDVDMILSHRDLYKTKNLVEDVVRSLEDACWITHTLTLSLTATKRDQQVLPFRGGGEHGSGFDTLDKALVVWQDPKWDVPPDAQKGEGSARNPNIHRRVDIIIAPWTTVGCAIVGWSGGTTFQRDLRNYVTKVKNYKFDSSGIRDRASGQVVDLEAVGGVSKTWMEAERKVFAGLGLEYREAWERCTG